MGSEMCIRDRYEGEDGLEQLRPEERPYAMEAGAFRQLLTELKALSPRWVDSSAQWPRDESKLNLMLTFDDGHRSALELATPAMSELEVPGVFFVTSDFVRDRSDYLSKSDLREMVSMGMQVQSHGQTHRFLNTLTPAQATAELADSKHYIEQATGKKVGAISFPGGRFGNRELELGRNSGYEDFYTSKFGRNGICLLYTSPSPRDLSTSRMPSSA